MTLVSVEAKILSFIVKLIILLLLAIFALWGCAIAPRPIDSRSVAWEGNHHDAGIVRPLHDAYGHPAGFLVRTGYAARYQSLAAEYGNRFHPSLKPEDGLTPYRGFWIIDMEHAVEMETMSRWNRNKVITF